MRERQAAHVGRGQLVAGGERVRCGGNQLRHERVQRPGAQFLDRGAATLDRVVQHGLARQGLRGFAPGQAGERFDQQQIRADALFGNAVDAEDAFQRGDARGIVELAQLGQRVEPRLG